MDNNSYAARRASGDGELKRLVAAAISTRQVAGLSFTAYEITQELRSSNPDVEIDHNEVRQAVYAIAPAYGYDYGVMTDFGAYQATLYSPRPAQSGGTAGDAVGNGPDTDTSPLDPADLSLDGSLPDSSSSSSPRLLLPGINQL